jgi:hypothetical protein
MIKRPSQARYNATKINGDKPRSDRMQKWQMSDAIMAGLSARQLARVPVVDSTMFVG